MRTLTCLFMAVSLLGQAEPPSAQSDYAAAAAALRNGTPASPKPPGGSGAPAVAHPKPDVPLNPSEQQAVRASASWPAEANVPAPGPDGRVVYSFGAGLPTVVCAPLRVCIIELQTGEKIVGEPQIGDSVRWNIAPAMYGVGGDSTSLIVLKPQMPGLDTNLLVTTDRRAYYIRLVSRAEEYVSRVAFAYPDDDNERRWQERAAEERSRAQRQEQTQHETLPAMIAVENLNFAYSVTGKDEQLRPARVYDDGAKTYIEMRPEMQHREAPVLLVIGNDGKAEMTNYRVKNQTYIVDRLFDRAELVLGAGKKAKGHRVQIARERRG
jgi:type IV secretion system protein TrbG